MTFFLNFIFIYFHVVKHQSVSSNIIKVKINIIVTVSFCTTFCKVRICMHLHLPSTEYHFMFNCTFSKVLFSALVFSIFYETSSYMILSTHSCKKELTFMDLMLLISVVSVTTCMIFQNQHADINKTINFI